MSAGSLRIPTATYRVQFSAKFTFADALAIVPYLDSLGISHLYASPVLAARTGSTHGYDVVDPTRVNPELGTDADWRALSNALHARGMGLVLDIVPNHMGTGAENSYWEDVLRHGEHASHAHWFDIDWDAERDADTQRSRVVLPVLGDELDAVIARHELRVAVRDGELRLTYFDSSWPVNAESAPPQLELMRLDPTSVASPDDLLARDEDEPTLRALLDAQHYRLTFWRRGPREIDYRRFFDVNDLVALRNEDARVFEETHALVLSWVREGVVDGLRVDHIDGLLDPLTYLRRLRAAVGDECPIWVEKILSPGETLRADWPVQGTTGYEFLNDADDLLIDPVGFATIERAYRAMRGLPDELTFAAIAYEGKRRVLEGPLRADVARLVRHLRPIADSSGERARADEELRLGIVHFMCGLPVYRTYLSPANPELTADERTMVDRALEHVAQFAPEAADDARFVHAVVTGRGREQPGWLRFVQRLQQTSGPATAKGVEDTALYSYVPLASRNEVGGAPDRPLADAGARCHHAARDRMRDWPHTLICTNTHDTKRSADARARIDALADVPDEWNVTVERWRDRNARFRSAHELGTAPDENAEWLFYETVIGIWPERAPDDESLGTLTSRVREYMLKATREAKERTSWTSPDAEYEEALTNFVNTVLSRLENGSWLDELQQFVARISVLGRHKSLARIAVHLTSPGVPDIYRGDELWNFTLVDPDNRRPVDYDARRAALESRSDDKLEFMRALLRLRRESQALFSAGAYHPITFAAPADQWFGFARVDAERGDALITIIRLRGPAEFSSDRCPLEMPEFLRGRRWRDVREGPDEFAESELPRLLGREPVSVIISSAQRRY